MWRQLGANGRFAGDTLGLLTDDAPGQPLLVPVMRGGQILAPADTLRAARSRAAAQLAALPLALRELDVDQPYAVEVSPSVRALADAVDRRT